jgi:hypothetical protein
MLWKGSGYIHLRRIGFLLRSNECRGHVHGITSSQLGLNCAS